jgi:molybdopterin-containing oxidoreductase family membrane subunit
MWLERFLIIIPGLARKTPMSFNWSTYHPSIIEILIVVGTFAFVSMMVLLFAKVAPLVPLYDIKEGQILKDYIQIGKVRVPSCAGRARRPSLASAIRARIG